MSAYRWTPERHADLRDRASRATGAILWPDAVLGLLDALDAAERRAADADRLRAQIAAVEAIHRPVSDELVCGTCMDSRGANQAWPCDTAEALSGVA